MNDVTPNQGFFPSHVTDSPFMWPYLQAEPGTLLDVQAVAERTAVYDPATMEAFAPQGPVNMLARLRYEFPYVPFVPFPNQVRTVALTQNVARDIIIPDGAAAIKFFGSGAYYVSNQGNAEIPNVANDMVSQSVYKPEHFAFYVAGVRTLSLISPDANCVVTMIAFIPKEMPR